MIVFFGPRVEVLSQQKNLTGGVRRFAEAVKCMTVNGAIHISKRRELYSLFFRRKLTIVTFDERYLFFLLPYLLVRKKVIFFPRGNKLQHFKYSYSSYRLIAYRILFSFLYKLSTVLVFQTRAQYKEFKEVYKYKGRYEILPNNIRTSWIKPLMVGVVEFEERTGLPLKIGFLGGSNPRKGFALLYKALFPLIEEGKVVLHVAGAKKGLFTSYTVVPHGFITDIKDFYERCDLVMVPSEYDSFPNVILESLAFGIVPLVGNNPISQEIFGKDSCLLFNLTEMSIRDKVNSYIVERSVRVRMIKEASLIFHKYDFDWCKSVKRIIFTYK